MTTQALKPLFSIPSGTRRNVESRDLRAFCISAATLDRTPHAVRACMGRSEQNTGTLSPGASRPAFLSGTEQASGATVEPTRLRLNDSLKGL